MLQLTRKDILLICLLLLLFFGLFFASRYLLGEFCWLVGLGFLLVVILAIQLTIYRRIQHHLAQQSRERNLNYQQIEALFSIFSLIRLSRPLPAMRGWAASPDFLASLISLIQERKPNTILETGSGVSTLVAGYILKDIGKGKIISLDHDEHYAENSTKELKKHQLDNIASVVYAPLKEYTISGKKMLWYHTPLLNEIKLIDMLIVDGPPESTQKLARYPALPLLIDSLSDDAIIILDDGNREGEQEIVKLWLAEFPGFIHQKIESEKGTVILRRMKRG